MVDKRVSLKLIGFSLAVYYAATFLIYFQSWEAPQFSGHALVLSVLFALLTLGAILLSKMDRLGWEIIFYASVAVLLYSVMLYFATSDQIFLTYALISVIIPTYYNQKHIKNQFSGGSERFWKSVLIIDDDEGVIKTLRPALISNGYSVLSAGSGEVGIEIARKQLPDLIILDVILPGIKGREVCRQLKDNASTKSTPIIFLTAKDSKDDIEAEKMAGAQAHLTKPVSTAELLRTVGSFLKN